MRERKIEFCFRFDIIHWKSYYRNSMVISSIKEIFSDLLGAPESWGHSIAMPLVIVHKMAAMYDQINMLRSSQMTAIQSKQAIKTCSSFIHLFIYLFIHPFIHSFIQSVSQLVSQSFIQSFINIWLGNLCVEFVFENVSISVLMHIVNRTWIWLIFPFDLYKQPAFDKQQQQQQWPQFYFGLHAYYQSCFWFWFNFP